MEHGTFTAATFAVVLSAVVAGVVAPMVTDSPTTPAPSVVADEAPAPGPSAPAAAPEAAAPEAAPAAPKGKVTFAFAGDIHFEGAAADVVNQAESTLGDLTRTLRAADVSVVNLETAVTNRLTPADKELEDPNNRYWFRTPPAAFGVLARSGVDVASIANNHGGDYGVVGLLESMEAAEESSVALVGAGENAAAAFRPYQTTVNGNSIAVFGADASMRESRAALWGATRTEVGLAAARGNNPQRLLAAVRRSAANTDIVVVYLHWGEESASCETTAQTRLARQLSEAGADVVVGAHSHTLLGSGVLRGSGQPGQQTYVNYGLGNFVWYHNRPAQTGVLQVSFDNGQLVSDNWVPGEIPSAGGLPTAVTGAQARTAVRDWAAQRSCGGSLAEVPEPPAPPTPEPAAEPTPEPEPQQPAELRAFTSSMSEITPAIEARMASSHDASQCPVPLSDLRLIRVTHVDFTGAAQQGEMIVHADYAQDLIGVFKTLYEARWPIQQMRLVSEFGSDDDRSMAANNSSAYNCRTVAGQTSWSRHAYGAAVDLNPTQNPYLTAEGILPPNGAEFADIDRSDGAPVPQGAIGEGDVVVEAFESIGWTWGGRWSEADFQHFNAP